MSSKVLDAKTLADLSRYTPEELDADVAGNQTQMDAFIARNREALNRALAAGYVSLENGEGVAIRSLEDLLSALDAERSHRTAK